MSYEYFAKNEKIRNFKLDSFVNYLEKHTEYKILSSSQKEILLKFKDELKTYGKLQDIELILDEDILFIVIYNSTRYERHYFINFVEKKLKTLGIYVEFEEE